VVALAPLANAPAAFGERSRSVTPAPLHSRISDLRSDLQFSFERSPRKKLRGDESKAKHALPDEREAGGKEQRT